MHIHYDWEVLQPELLEHFTEDALFILFSIREFLEQRYSVLEDEMNKEWETDKAIVMIISPKDKSENYKIGYAKFSKELTVKLESCISDQDISYLNHKLMTGLAKFFN